MALLTTEESERPNALDALLLDWVQQTSFKEVKPERLSCAFGNLHNFKVFLIKTNV